MLATIFSIIEYNRMSSFEKPIFNWFIPRVTPYGGAPVEIKEAWIDVPLPLRYQRPAEGPDPTIGHEIDNIYGVTILADSASVVSVDAIKALRIFERNEAAEWWEEFFAGRIESLAFAVETVDQVLPDSFMRLVMPGIEHFDEI